MKNHVDKYFKYLDEYEDVLNFDYYLEQLEKEDVDDIKYIEVDIDIN